jgi:NAD(P)-dependent dehydrogenase (short-subunit alcohol dehydrogenase family)
MPQVAFVTGGAAGIGFALVRRLLELGASVASIDIANDALLRQQEREFGDTFGADRIMMVRRWPNMRLRFL